MNRLIVQKKPQSVAAEAYRTLRTNLQHTAVDKKIKTILITSPRPREGKTTVAANLALIMIQDNKKVLIVDCDFRKPSLYEKFNISNTKGLSDYLISGKDLNEIVVQYSDNLYILTSGTVQPNPSEMLSSIKMKRFMEIVYDKFDYIIIDSPPINLVTDAQIISTMVDGVLLVISIEDSIKEECINAKELLLKVKANILGIVANKIPLDNNYRYYSHNKPKVKKKCRKVKGKHAKRL